MIEHLGNYWFMYFGVVASALLLRRRFLQTDASLPRGRRLRLLAYRRANPDSPLYDPGLFGRQLHLLFIGLPLIGITLLVVWLLGR